MKMEALAEDEEYTTRPRDRRQQWRRQGIDNGSKESTTITEASAEDKRRIQGIRDKNGGGDGSATGSVDLQSRQSINFP